MGFPSRLGLVVFTSCLGSALSGCSGANEGTGAPTSQGGSAVEASGGAAQGGNAVTASEGGASAVGGNAAQSGGSSSGGAIAAGGASNAAGGNKAAGGAIATGGTKALGGAATGGTKAAGGAIATGGTKATGGTATGGVPATGGAKATGGTQATGGATSSTCTPWPTAKGTTALTATRSISGSFDGGLQRFTGWGGTQDENQDPLFELANNATLSNVIIGAPAGDGIHCLGSCTLKNVWWEDVGEDAATLRGSSSSQVMTIDCAGAKSASDKIFQHNGPGTMIIKNFWAQTFGKIYRSCGNCSTQYERHVILSNITATGGSSIAGINTNYKDTASFWNVSAGGATLCQRFTGNNTGAEPVSTGSGIDGTYCINLTSAP